MANNIIGGIPNEVKIHLHGSYADVYKGHGTDKALVAGLLGLAPDSEKVVESFKLAKKANMSYEFITTNLGSEYHPNTAKFELTDQITITGQSIGAGNIEIIEINGIRIMPLEGKSDTVIALQKDVPGVAAQITSTLAKEGVNIAEMNISRESKGGNALTILNIDNKINQNILDQIAKNENVIWVRLVNKLE
jgi:L-serine dehydratase